ncbi:MAG: hypothetical protein ABJA35_14400 [Parafilimonas sp.]
MKNFHSKIAAIAPFVFFPILLIVRKKRRIVYVLALFAVITLSSCFLNFYRTNTKTSIDAANASRLSSENKYFIIHFSNSIKGLENSYVKDDSLYGTMVPLPPEHAQYLHPNTSSRALVVKAKDKKNALVEVHLYTNSELKETDSLFAASVLSFNRADVYELREGATKTNHILSVVGIVAGAVLIIGAIVAAASCNCPQVYVDNNGTYNFSSGLYSGAVYSTLERTDYLPLNTVPYNAKDISFKIANAKNEEQFINKVELLQVNHASDVNVLADRHGAIYSYEKTMATLSATTNDKNDIKNVLSQTDEQYYSFDNAANKDGFSDVTLTFDKPKDADNAKLIIHARNTYWGGLIHKEFINLFGDEFEKWRTKQEAANAKDLEKWQTDQALPLMVYIKINNEWKFVDYYQLIGNTASRDMVMHIDTKNIPGDKIELKLETAYRFWDLDFAGIDYSNNENFTATVVEPTEVIKSDSTNETATLQNSDKEYVHLVNDEFISFKYSIPQSADNNTKASYFLVSGGYYHSLEHITGKADYNALIRFKKQGAFDKFSREKYKEVQDVAAVMNSLNKK